MERFVKGDVVVFPFVYSDQTGYKRRPALVIATLKGDNVILAQITTKKRNDEDLISLSKKDFYQGQLSQESFIITSKIFTIDSLIIEYRAGKINKEKIKEVEERLVKVFTR